MAELNAAADAAITITELRLMAPDGARSVWLDGFPASGNYVGHNVRVSVQDQAGLVDINAAGHDLLVPLFREIAMLDESAAEGLVDKIMDWRKRGVGKRLQGAKANDYALRGRHYAPREGPFQSVSELGLVLDLSPAILQKISLFVTIYSQKSFVDPEFAPEAVLALLPGMTANRAVTQVAERERRHLSPDAEPTQQLSLVGRSFRITATLEESDGMILSKSTVLRATGGQAQPFWFYRTSQ